MCPFGLISNIVSSVATVINVLPLGSLLVPDIKGEKEFETNDHVGTNGPNGSTLLAE